MVLHPAVQAKAREELDTVVGRGRLPDFTDRGSLPYIDGIVKETLRFVLASSYRRRLVLMKVILPAGGVLSLLLVYLTW